MSSALRQPNARQPPQPETLRDLEVWVHEQLHLPVELERALLTAVEGVVTRHERLWRESKQEAIQSLSAGFADKMTRVQHELNAKEATVSSIARYFEHLVADLTEKVHHDPKTKLMNLGHFMLQLESTLALEQRGRWCAIGLVDIANFKRYNDTMGHQLGDRIIERVAQILRQQVRSDDLLAKELPGQDLPLDTHARDLHARFGGDEFCFLIPAIAEAEQAYAVGERFRTSVADYEWSREDHRLADNPPRVDVGVVCLWLGRTQDRKFVPRQLAAALIQRADQLMYQAKDEARPRVQLSTYKMVDGRLAEIGAEQLG